MKKAFITGISGQDGSYLTEFLLEKNYQVYGLIRPTSNRDYLPNLDPRITLLEGDVTQHERLSDLIKTIQPDEIYNLAGVSFPPISWEKPASVMNTNTLSVVSLLEATRNYSPQTKYYQASTSEMFGSTSITPQNEETPFRPRNPYGLSKTSAHSITGIYRDHHGLFACCGILYNHESPRRGQEYLTQKTSMAVARIKLGLQEKLIVGNLDAQRDWGYAPDYVRAMWLMLQQENPDDYVIATGKTHTVREFIEHAFNNVDIPIQWEGLGLNERGIDPVRDKELVTISQDFFRLEKNLLVGDTTKAKKILHWQPTRSFNDLVHLLVHAALEKIPSECP